MCHIHRYILRCFKTIEYFFSGGTVDITIHEKSIKKTVKEVYKANGGAWGGTKVDRLFEAYLVSFLSEPVVQKIKKDYPVDWLEMMRGFENIKRDIDHTHTDFCLFSLKPSIFNVYKELQIVDLRKCFGNNIYARGATLDDTILNIPKGLIFTMFEEVCNDIAKHVTGLLHREEIKDINSIIMVGGFSNASILSDKIKSISGNTPVIVPEEAELAVLKGATLFGWNTDFIAKRRSKKTYGRRVAIKFNPELDRGREAHPNSEGELHCLERFYTLVTVNQEIYVGHKIRHVTFPFQHEQDIVSFDIYASEKEVVRYCDEAGVEKIGKFVLPLPNYDVKHTERKLITDYFFHCAMYMLKH